MPTDDLTPESLDRLFADLGAMLAVEGAEVVARSREVTVPTYREGDRLAITLGLDIGHVFVAGQGAAHDFCYEFDTAGLAQVLAILTGVRDCVAEIWEFESPRVVRVARRGERVELCAERFDLTTTVDALLAAVR